MNLLDFLIIMPIAYFCYRGFINGLIKEVLSIIGIILAVFLTFQYMEPVSNAISPLFEANVSYIPFVSAIIIFITTLGIVHLVAYLSKKFLETIKLNFINRITGAAFGFLKSGIVISAALLILAGFSVPSQEARENSATYPHIVHLAPWAFDTIATIYPGAEDFAATLDKTLEQYNPIEHFPISAKNQN